MSSSESYFPKEGDRHGKPKPDKHGKHSKHGKHGKHSKHGKGTDSTASYSGHSSTQVSVVEPPDTFSSADVVMPRPEVISAFTRVSTVLVIT